MIDERLVQATEELSLLRNENWRLKKDLAEAKEEICGLNEHITILEKQLDDKRDALDYYVEYGNEPGA